MKKVDFLTANEVSTLLEAGKIHYTEIFPLLCLAVLSGMRRGELVAVQWGDIDWNGKFINVQRSEWQGQIGLTKSGKTRKIDMSDQLIAVLTAIDAV